jgi:hypothetical protein
MYATNWTDNDIVMPQSHRFNMTLPPMAGIQQP